MYEISWFIIFLALLLFEICTMGLTTIWFAIGALAAFFVAIFDAEIIVQVIVFFAVSIVMLLVTRPFAKKYVNSKTIKTNVDALIGKTGKVEEVIDNINATGQVFIDGNQWTARSKDDSVIEKDTIVKIVEIEGVKVIVERQ